MRSGGVSVGERAGLTRCPDCGRVVSVLALACPQCARPIAAFASRAGEVDPADAATVGRDIPEALQRWRPDPEAAHEAERRLSLSQKSCNRCGQPVDGNIFRLKTASGYLCDECQDDDHDRQVRRRETLVKVRRAAVVLLVIGVFVFVLVYMIAQLPSGSRR